MQQAESCILFGSTWPVPICSFHAKTLLRARGTLFWPEVAGEPTKMDETWTIRSEIARVIVSNRSGGPDMHKMNAFATISAIEMALQPPVTEIAFRHISMQKKMCFDAQSAF